jgi:hypothetical protein
MNSREGEWGREGKNEQGEEDERQIKYKEKSELIARERNFDCNESLSPRLLNERGSPPTTVYDSHCDFVVVCFILLLVLYFIFLALLSFLITAINSNNATTNHSTLVRVYYRSHHPRVVIILVQ